MTRKSISYFSLTVRWVGVALGCVSWGAWAQPNRGQLPPPVEEVENPPSIDQPSIEKKLTVKAIVVEGSTAFSSQEFESITAPYTNKTASLQEIEADILSIIAVINELYQERGYLASVVGENQGTATLEHLNLFGLGDRAVVQYNKTEGLEQVYVGYTIPLNARDGTLSLRYSSGNSKVIADPFERFDLTSESQGDQ